MYNWIKLPEKTSFESYTYYLLLEAILRCRQPREKLIKVFQYENLMSNNFQWSIGANGTIGINRKAPYSNGSIGEYASH